MTATTQSARPTTRNSRLSFGGILASEWIKFWTLRSTIWCCAILVVLVLGVGFIVAAVASSNSSGTIPHLLQQATVARDATGGLFIAVLILSVLGVLAISGEYGTGMIRSTLTAVPRRTPAFVGKGLVLAIVSAILALLATYGTALLQLPFLAASGIHADFTGAKLNYALLGGALFVLLVTLMSFGIGGIVRNGAAGITTSLGLLLVAPIVIELIAGLTQSKVLSNIAAFLPSQAGGQLYSYGADKGSVVQGIITLSAWQGGLVLLGWAVIANVLALLLLKRRDV